MRSVCGIAIVLLIMGFGLPLEPDRPPYPQDYFAAPVDIPMFLSGTFGEVRSSHFHSGIDIKTNQKEGMPVLASADGYVSRIKVSPYGFGKALYITHPNGFVTVYAHLQKFGPEIEAYVKAQQYKKECFKIELFPGPEQFRCKQGELVAYSGNTGGSGGPHLHFEVRDGATQKPINPQLFGFDIKDNIQPEITLLAVYEYPGMQRSDARLFEISGSQGKLGINTDTISIGSKSVSFGVRSFDRLNGASNRNGLYSLKLFIDNEMKYQFEMEKFAFSETRYVGCHIDSKLKHHQKQTLQRCYLLPGNRFSAYRNVVDKGIVELTDPQGHEVCIEAEDANGNRTALKFMVKSEVRSDAQNQANTPENVEAANIQKKQLKYDQYNTFHAKGVSIAMPKGVLFEDLEFRYHAHPLDWANAFSKLHHVHSPEISVYKYFNLSIDGSELPPELRSKALIAEVDEAGTLSSVGGDYDDGWVKTRIRQFGSYFITIDTIAPAVELLNYSTWNTQAPLKSLRVRVSDDLTGITSYSGTVDGQWILMEYDAKNDLLFHDFDEKIKPGAHEFVLTAVDGKSNQTVVKSNFIR